MVRRREETNISDASLCTAHGNSILTRFAARVCYVVVGKLYLGLIHSHFLCDILHFSNTHSKSNINTVQSTTAMY